ncbi:MAG TPA: M20/M25/M40 family metallo-hydrolase [Longimicrobiaceae bacterium]|nr:M20/M25/M40 family metallo-hydrolase [Longimicrobiaceae bacterium]
MHRPLRPLRTAPLALLLAAAPASLAAQPLTADERRVVRYVDVRTEEAVGLLQRLVDINSGTMNHAGVREVGRVLRAQLDSLGFRTRWIAMPDAVNRAGHLFAERDGGRGKRLLLIGHLDTVFEESSPFQRFTRSGTTAAGPGVNDMKGGNVVIVYALRALHAAGLLEGTRIVVAFTGDEESAGQPLGVSRGDLVEAGKRADAALEFEGGSRGPEGEYAVTARRSASSWTLRVRARPGHSSGIFREGSGSGAIFEAARILTAFHEELRGEPYLSFNPGVVLGGTEVSFEEDQGRGTAFGKDNVIAATAVASGDVRTISDEQLQRVRERMREIVARSLPQAQAEITFTDGYPSMSPTPGNAALLETLNGVNRDLGVPPMRAFDPARRGAADISFVAPYVDGLAGLGVHGSGSHTDRETVDLSTLPLVIKRAALLIHRLTREPPLDRTAPRE